jgi:hypothetical protein
VLRGTFIPQRQAIRGSRRKLLYNLYFSPNIIRTVKLRRIGKIRHVPCTKIMPAEIHYGNLKGRDHFLSRRRQDDNISMYLNDDM